MDGDAHLLDRNGVAKTAGRRRRDRAPNGCLVFNCQYEVTGARGFCRCHWQKMPAMYKYWIKGAAARKEVHLLAATMDYAGRLLALWDQPLLLAIDRDDEQVDLEPSVAGLSEEVLLECGLQIKCEAGKLSIHLAGK